MIARFFLFAFVTLIAASGFAQQLPKGVVAELRTTSFKPSFEGKNESGIWIFENGKAASFAGDNGETFVTLAMLSDSVTQKVNSVIREIASCKTGETDDNGNSIACAYQMWQTKARQPGCADGSKTVIRVFPPEGFPIVLKSERTCGPVLVLGDGDGAYIVDLLESFNHTGN